MSVHRAGGAVRLSGSPGTLILCLGTCCKSQCMWDSYSPVVHKAYSVQFGSLLATTRLIWLQNIEILPLLTPWRAGTSEKPSQQAHITCCFSKFLLLPTIWLFKTYCKNTGIQWNWTESQEQLMHHPTAQATLLVHTRWVQGSLKNSGSTFVLLSIPNLDWILWKISPRKGLPKVLVEWPSLKVFRRCVQVEPCLSGGLGSAGIKVGVNDPKGLFQLKQLHHFMILYCSAVWEASGGTPGTSEV